MGLVATMREIKENVPEELQRLSPDRTLMIDGSLSELVSQALNFAYTKKNITTGEPFYGTPNPTGEPPPGAGNIPNILKPDEPQTKVIRPSLEGMQQMQEAEADQIAAVLAGAIDANGKNATQYLAEDPVIIYALPSDGMVSEEMNASVGMYGDSGSIDVRDFVFVYTDTVMPGASGSDDTKMYDLNQKVKDYEGRGARVFPDLQSFLNAVPDIRRRR